MLRLLLGVLWANEGVRVHLASVIICSAINDRRVSTLLQSQHPLQVSTVKCHRLSLALLRWNEALLSSWLNASRKVCSNHRLFCIRGWIHRFCSFVCFLPLTTHRRDTLDGCPVRMSPYTWGIIWLKNIRPSSLISPWRGLAYSSCLWARSGVHPGQVDSSSQHTEDHFMGSFEITAEPDFIDMWETLPLI